MEAPYLSSDAARAGSVWLSERGLGTHRLALGTAGLGGIWGTDTHESVDALLFGMQQGLTVWDTAPAYGSAEISIGNALRQWKGPRPVISTKVGRTHNESDPATSYRPETLRETLSRSLERMGLDSVDLLFLHEPEKMDPTLRGPALETLLQMREDGLTRHLGLGGGWGRAWDGWLESKEFSAVIVFLSLDACCLDSVPTDVPRLREAGVAIYGGSPLHMGLLAARPPEKTPWAKPHALRGFARLQELSRELGMTTIELSHRFVYSLRALDRVLIGPRNLAELTASLGDFARGALDPPVFDRIYQSALAEAVPRYS